MNMQLVDERDIAKRLSISVAKLRKDRLNQVGIPTYKIGRSVRYDLNDVLNHLDKNSTPSAKR